MGSLKLLLPVMILGMCSGVGAVAHLWFGNRPRPRKKSVPGISPSVLTERNSRRGSGTAKEGAQLYVQKGARHATGNRVRRPGSYFDRSEAAPTKPATPCLVALVNPDAERHGAALAVRDDDVGLHQPRHASRKEGTLKPDEVYALTAFLLYKNGVIKRG